MIALRSSAHRSPLKFYCKSKYAMGKAAFNEQRLANRPQLRDASATPKSSPIIAVARRHSPSRIPHSPFTKCHHVTLTEKMYSQNEPI